MNKRTTFSKCLFFALSITFISCSSIEVFKENAEIAPQKVYSSYVIVNQEVGMRGFSSQFIDQNVQIHLQEHLEESGFRYEKSRPDLVIRYTSNEDQRQKEVVQNPYAWSPLWGRRIYDPWMFNPYGPSMDQRVRTSDYELIQVIVDFIDPEKDQFLMTLTGVTEVGSPSSKERRILKTVDKIIDRFISEIQPTQ